MISRLRSLRVRAFLVVIAGVVTPFLFVGLADVFNTGAAQRMKQEVVDSATDAAKLLRDVPRASPQLPLGLDALARRRQVRIRVLSQQGEILQDLDREARSTLFDDIGGFFFGPSGAPTLRGYDDKQPPLRGRPEIQGAWRAQRSQGCDVPIGEKTPIRLLLICHAALRVDGLRPELPLLVFTQKSERRTIRAIEDIRYQLLKLLFLLLAVGTFLGWWLGWRMVRPIEALREQVLRRTAGPIPALPISLQRKDEFAELAHAFNRLLETLAERSRANEAFVADLVHEMKNPVAAIHACAESMDTDEPIDKARAKRLSRVLSDSSRRLNALVTSFLDLARAEAGLPNEERAVVDVHALLKGLIESLSSERYSDVRFTLTGSCAEVFAVCWRLETALLNLLHNAASFAGTGGAVVVQISGPPEEIEISVTDSGPGIAAADLARIFDRFFTTRASGQGTGLGLPLARAILEAHGGTLTAASPPGQAAIFTARLPRCQS